MKEETMARMQKPSRKTSGLVPWTTVLLAWSCLYIALSPVWYVNRIASTTTSPDYTSPNLSRVALTTTSMQKEDHFVVFVRIPKTGSSSMMNFLYDYSGMDPLRTIVPNDYALDQPPPGLGKLHCIFADTKKDTRNNDEESNDDEESINDDEEADPYYEQCGHQNYGALIRAWEDAYHEFYSPAPMSPPSTLQAFTIVREPFERLKSLFHYMKKHPRWSGSSTPRQRALIENGDFRGWFLSRGGKREKYQYEYLSRDVDEAIEMMNSGMVTVVVNECFEASLRLLEAKFPSFSRGGVDEFINSQDSSVNKGYYKVDDQEEEEELRKKARVWYANEYKFYNAAVAQFKLELSTSQIHPLMLQSECV